MKKVFINLKSNTILTVVILLSSLCVQSFASVHALITPENKKLVVDISDLYGDHASCMIKDQEGTIVFAEKLAESDQVIKKYDLSQLKQGLYELILEDAMSVEIVKFELTDTKINYVDKARTVYKPTIIKKADDLVYLNQLALNKKVKIAVTKNGEDFFTKTYEGESSISKKIDFSTAEKGDYVIKVSILGETFYNTVSI